MEIFIFTRPHMPNSPPDRDRRLALTCRKTSICGRPAGSRRRLMMAAYRSSRPGPLHKNLLCVWMIGPLCQA